MPCFRGVGLFIGIEITKDQQSRTPGAREATVISYRYYVVVVFLVLRVNAYN